MDRLLNERSTGCITDSVDLAKSPEAESNPCAKRIEWLGCRMFAMLDGRYSLHSSKI